ncbi:alginate export family protein [Paraflavisolibacter sp. H34]|uniref:alginate export family protein n=1 Tax=Huijunlia imazamoxiresistens TaxID=3127457 RepID=UPI0030163F30
MRKLLFPGWGLWLALSCLPAAAQFNLDGQLVQRSEYRNGYGRLIAQGADPAAFIAHRARLQAGYQKDIFTFQASIQDVRTWGNSPQTKLTDNYLSLHEAWLELKVSPEWKIKLGRQELNYDNFRFLGNLDWALQARAHDFALVKYEKDALKFHVGGGYNQDAQQLSGNIFTTANQYKLAQLIRYENMLGKVQFGLLFWNDGRQYVQTGTNGQVEKKGVRHRQTAGVPVLRYGFGKTTLSGFYYHQFGRDPQGRRMNGYDLSAQASRQWVCDSTAGRQLRLTAGLEYLSGTPTGDPSVNRSFSPLYGTNHAHNGYMDLFYVGGAHENSVGLEDYFLRGRYDWSRRFFSQLDGHVFAAQAAVYRPAGERQKAYLGTELDLSLGFLLHEAISLQGGYSQFFYSHTFEVLQNNNNLKSNQNWAYLMLIFRPTLKNKFIGLIL